MCVVYIYIYIYIYYVYIHLSKNAAGSTPSMPPSQESGGRPRAVPGRAALNKINIRKLAVLSTNYW